MSGELTVISTFAGCGGSSLGYKWAGFRELLAIDSEPHAVETFKLNFPGVDVWQADIRKVTAAAILKRTGIKKGELDVLDGSPPCQGFSTAGKRKVTDVRNDLAWEFIRLIDGLNPRAFVMENVSGMAKGGMRGRFNEILAGLKATGYRVEVRKLNAMYYGVPQSRERIIFIGMRERQEIEWPKRQAIITARDALDGCSSDGIPPRTDTKGNRLADNTRPGDSNSEHFSILRIARNRPAPTVPKSVTPNGTSQYLHFSEKRLCSIREISRLQTFGDEFRFVGSFTDQWARIGNAVPPKMMQAIAECVKEVLEGGE